MLNPNSNKQNRPKDSNLFHSHETVTSENEHVSAAERRMYILQQLDKGGTNYNMPIVLKVHGNLMKERVLEVFHKLIERHEAFRTVFTLIDGKPRQKVYERVDFTLPMFKVNNTEEFHDLLSKWIQPFDLGTAPLMRACLIESSHEIYLAIDMHHIISDGFSMGILVQEFATLYAGSTLPELQVTYRDYRNWQRTYQTSEKFKAEEDYWMAEYSGEIPTLNLPLDNPRGATRSFQGDVVYFTIGEELVQRLRKFSASEKSTIFMTLFTVYNLLLAKYTGQDEIIVGTPIAGRSNPDFQRIIGMFVNTLALRTHLRPEEIFTNYLQQVKTKLVQAFSNQNYPFDQLIEKLKVANDASRNPLFDAFFSLQASEDVKRDFGGLSFETVAFESKVAKFDLSLDGFVQDGEVKLMLEYAKDLFTRQKMEQMASHFLNLLKNVLTTPEKSLLELEILSPVEKEQILHEFNNLKTDYPKNEVIHQLFERQAGKTPERIALRYNDQVMSYRELNSKANQLARYIRGKGVGAETIVALLIKPSLEQIIAMLAVLKAGGAYLPIDVSNPIERVKLILTDSKPLLVMTTEKQIDSLYEVETLDVTNERLYTGDSTNLANLVYPEYLAYIIYTSGSTGKPKGVMVEHRNVVAYDQSFAHEFPWTEEDVITHVASYSFDASVDEIYHILFRGGSVVIVDKDDLLDMHRLTEILNNNQVTIFSSTPLVLNELNKLLPVSSIHTFLSGGDLLKPEYISNLVKYAQIYNVYGPTETTVCATFYRCEESLPKELPIGKPIANYPIYILDKYGQPVPIGVEGEIYISGVGVARGYLERAELTAEKFLPDPFNSGLRMYRTGDLGRWLPDGTIKFVGRVDYQVKIRGFRIELGEIENALMQYSGVEDAIVIDRKDGLGQSYLCAYIVPCKLPVASVNDFHEINQPPLPEECENKSDIVSGECVNEKGLNKANTAIIPDSANVEENRTEERVAGITSASVAISDKNEIQHTTAAFKNYLSNMLPDYMIPTHYVLIPEVPYTSIGKVDRNQLPEPMAVQSADYIPPANEVEEKLATIWASLLGTKQISRTDQFFALGGHSLKATALATHIYQTFNVQLPLRQIFDHATLEEQANLIIEAESQQYIAIPPAKQQEYYPASSAQKRLYILQQYEGIQTTYNLPGVFLIKGVLAEERFKTALQQLIQRHEALRTSFAMVNGEVVQRIHEDVSLPISYYAGDEAEWPEIQRSFIKPFDLSTAPLVRVGLIQSEEKACLLLDMHHIISDAVSMNIMIADFAALYQGADLEPLEIQYKDFAVWQNELFNSKEMQKMEQYWLETFTGELPQLNLPTDYPRPTVQSFAGDHYQFQIEPEILTGLKGLAQLQGVTLYMVLLATYSILLAKYSGQEDVVVGSPIAGRDYPGLENILGMFVNTLALRTQPTGEKTLLSYLAEVKENSLKAFENQDYPFEMLVERLGVQRNISRNPLFDTVFVLQNADEGELLIPDFTLTPLQVENKVSRFDLTMTMQERDTLYCTIEYSTKLFQRETIARLAKHFTNLLSQVIANPYMRLKDMEILTPEEKAELLIICSNGQADYPRNKTINQLFVEQVVKTPARTALKFGQESMCYSELNGKANRLARVLRCKGIGPNKIVALLMERSLDMVVAILATIKAGGAYLPMDPDYPRERIEYMLQDSAAEVLLTNVRNLPITYSGAVLNLPDEAIYQVTAEEMTLLAKKQNKSLETAAQEIEEFYIEEFSLDDEVATGAEDEKVNNQVTGTAKTLITDETDLENWNTPEDLLYIIYTSGSTGKPKGVMIEHRNLVRLMFNDRFQFDFTETDVWTMFHSYCFDFSVWEMYGALLYGGQLVIVPKLVAQNPQEYRNLLAAEKVTILNQTPTAFYKLQEAELENSTAELSVRYVIFGGEALKPQKLKNWHTRYPKTSLINMYGITETTVHVTYKEITEIEITASISNIGKPIPTLTTYILDRYLKLVPIGVAGELAVGGDGLARGYLNREELTAEKFVQHPYLPKERLYRSGDLARLLPNGEMEYLGRIDQQVKIRGFRIELGEIESKLLKHEAIREAVVIDAKDEDGQSYLIAYYVADVELSVGELRNFLKIDLPDYMIPAYFLPLLELPLTSNGKLDRRKLPMPEKQSSGRAYAEPLTEVEVKLAVLWQDILGIERVGRDDDFFELGGHSLKATTFVQRVKKELDVEIGLKDVFKKPILREMAELIRQAEKSDYTALTPVGERDHYPVSAAQKRIHLYHEIHGANTVYNIPAALIVEGKLDPERFKNAVQKVVQRHDALRTSFTKIAKELVQVIHSEVEPDFRELILDQSALVSTLGEARQNEYLDGVIRQFVQPFDLTQAPLLRVGLGDWGDGQILLFDMHHIISDGTSMGILIRDFLQAYEGEELPPLRVQYKDYAVWQNTPAFSELMKRQEEFWLESFADGVPELNLPLDFARPISLTTEGGSVTFTLEAEYADKLQELAQREGVTLFMVLLAAYTVLLAKYSGQTQIVTGTPVAGRTHADLEGIIGMFINTLAIKTNPAGEKGFREYLREVREITLKAFENQDYQFEMLVEKLVLQVAPNRTPLFDVLLVLQNMGGQSHESSSMQVRPYPIEAKNAKFDLALYVVQTDGLRCTLDYRLSLFQRETIELFTTRLVELLKEIIATPEKRISELCTAQDAEDMEDLSGFMDDLEDEF